MHEYCIEYWSIFSCFRVKEHGTALGFPELHQQLPDVEINKTLFKLLKLTLTLNASTLYFRAFKSPVEADWNDPSGNSQVHDEKQNMTRSFLSEQGLLNPLRESTLFSKYNNERASESHLHFNKSTYRRMSAPWIMLLSLRWIFLWEILYLCSSFLCGLKSFVVCISIACYDHFSTL